MSDKPMFVVDAFAEAPFTGNPAAVCLLDDDVPAEWQQQVAAEMNLPETAFLIPRGPAEWGLRWFTPTVEVDLCGHATLAAAHVLWQACHVQAPALAFHTRSGVLTATREERAVRLDFPAKPPTPAPASAALVQALGTTPEWVGGAGSDVLAVLARAEQIVALAPDLAGVAALDARGVIVTAPWDGPEYDFVSRFFAPRVGIPEDPVTGSAHCVLGPYWGERLGKDTLRAYQASARGGVLGVRLHDGRVYLSGRAVTVLEGRLHA